MKQDNYLNVSMYHIQLFLTLAEVRSFSLASNMLYIAQPTLTRRIDALERTLGLQLFFRDKRPVQLTPAGNYLYSEWKGKVADFQKSIETAHRIENRRQGTLSVAITSAHRRLRAMEDAAVSLSEQVEISTRYTRIDLWKNQMLTGDLDIFLTLLLEKDYLEESFSYEVIDTYPHVACMRKDNPLCTRSSLTFANLKDQKFIVNSPHVFPAYLKTIQKYCMECGFSPQIIRYTEDSNSLIWLIQNNDEIVVCDKQLRDADSPLVTCVPIVGPESGLIAVWQKNSRNPWIRPYLDKLKGFTRNNMN